MISKRMIFWAPLCCLGLSVLFLPARAQQLQSSIEALVENYANEKGFSGTVLVARDGQPLYHRSYGLAYIPASDRIQNDYHYSIASVTKLFSAIRVLQLVAEGEIALTTPINDYLPRWKNSISDRVSIHHLLLHISGLPYEKEAVYRHPSPPSELVSQTLENKAKAKLGEFNYKEIDYWLLGLLIEKVTGNKWRQEITHHILEPLEMEDTGFLEYGNYPDRFAYTYSYRGKSKPHQDPFFYIENCYSSASMYSTTLDLLKLDQALYGTQLLDEAHKTLLEKSYPEYGYAGYSVWNYNYPFVDAKPRVMERRGGLLGANVVLVRLLDSNQTIIVLSNDDRFNPDSFGDEENLREALLRALF